MHFDSSNIKFLIIISISSLSIRQQMSSLDGPIVFKMIVLGQQGVGKSSMLIRYIKGQFSGQYNVTVGVQFASKEVSVDANKQVNLQIWDTAGQQAFRAIVRSFYQGVSGVFLAFSLDDEESLQALTMWHKQVKQNGHQQVIFFLIGTKADLVQKRTISAQKAQQALIQLGAVFFVQTSAKTGQNIDELFQKAAQVMYKKYMISNVYRQISGSPALKRQKSYNISMLTHQQPEKEKSKCCK